MFEPIVSVRTPLALVGGADIGHNDLNTSLLFAPVVVAVDGGADHLLAIGRTPLAVIGDLDSLSDAARAAFGAVLHPVSEQETTDFEKALTRIAAPLILAVGFLGGRLDHTLAVLNTIVRHPHRPVILVSRDDVCFLARPVMSLRLTPGARVALLPLDHATVTTRGLRWDLHNAVLHPTGLISSSNLAQADAVSLRIDGKVIVTLPLSELAGVMAVLQAERPAAG
jgi:thiamine pyrophosphokinase